MGLMEGKQGIIFGVSNKFGIANAIAEQLYAAGAQIAFTYANEAMEKRVYNQTFDDKPTLDRIEQLEADLYGDIQKGSAIGRLNNLKTASMRHAIRGTSIPPSMMKNYKTKYLNNDDGYHDDVGLIDGFVRLWFPDFYAQVSKYRFYKESRGINDLSF